MSAVPSTACSDLYPMEENPYEPLDPPITAPSRKHAPDPPGMVWASIGTRQCSPNWGPAAPSGPVVTSPSVPRAAELPPGQAAAGGGCGPGGLGAAQHLPPLPWDKAE